MADSNGLLDFIKTPEGQGLLSAAFGGMAGARKDTPWNNFGRAGVAGIAGYADAKDRAEQEAYKNLQMENLKAQIADRDLTTSMVNYFMPGAAPSKSGPPSLVPVSTAHSQTALPTTATIGVQPSIESPSVPTPKGSALSRMTPDMLAALKLKGKDLTDVYKLTQPNWQNVDGYMVNTNDPDFKGGFQPGISMSQDGKTTMRTVGPDGQITISAPRGAVDTFTGYQNAQKEAEARYTPLDPDKYVPRDGSAPARTVLDYVGGSRTNGDGLDLSRLSPQQIAYLQKKDPTAFNNGVVRFAASQSGDVMNPMQKEAARLPISAQQDINTTWLKNSYEPIVNAGNSANDMLTNIQAARIPLANIGKTGWGTEARANTANILTGLGIGTENAKLFASNAQQFQNIAMTNLKTSLDAAKGPQTEGDAGRASKTFASLENTPQANEFILDLAEAKARRDAMKAQFYQNALPIAKSKGDLQEVDREWQKRAPSIFSMPTMQKWAVKK